MQGYFDCFLYVWNFSYLVCVGVMLCEGGNEDVWWFDIEFCYVYYLFNVYLECWNGVEVLVLDVVCYLWMFDCDWWGFGGDSWFLLDCWIINLVIGVVIVECCDDWVQEFFCINEILVGGLYCFVYIVGIEGGFFGGVGVVLLILLYKQDCVIGFSMVVLFDFDLLIGEMVFVLNLLVCVEDDGIFMGYGWYCGCDEGQLFLLDVQIFELIVIVYLLQCVLMGFYGNWVLII